MAESYTARVVEVIPETEDAHSIVLEVDDGATFTYKPGQFLTVAVPSDRTGTVARCYSLASAPHETDLLKITVKRTVEGYGSNWICDNISPGHHLQVLPPSGIFTPADLDADFLLFAGGSGITPVMSIAKSALAQGSGKVVLLYANRDERSVIFARDLAELAEKHPDRFVVVHWLESVQGLPTPEHMKAFAEHFLSHDAFVCGPGPFMSGVVQALKELGFPRERRHQEKFVSLGGNPFGDQVEDTAPETGDEDLSDQAKGRTTLATLVGELDGRVFELDDWPADKPILDHLLDKGFQAPFSCREGQCSACACRILEGEVTMMHNEVLDDEDLADGIRLACQSLPVSDSVTISYE
ncbi:MAG TPA: ferredoxin--NADP reductase [Nocardioidaceae bacterium]|nr:ferredoxin--NADP reductase [Nocardioidaceae bacterium]